MADKYITRWAVRKVLTEPQPEFCYALMALSIFGVWTDRAWCADEEEALGLVALLNAAEEARRG